jgi:HprK-related kinase A
VGRAGRFWPGLPAGGLTRTGLLVHSAGQCLGDLPVSEIQRRLGREGIDVDLGLVRVRVSSDSPTFSAQFREVYAGFPATLAPDWVGLHVQLRRRRRWLMGWKEQVDLWHDGRLLFEPFPAAAPLPLFEWGVNWLIARSRNDVLLLHAAIAERDGLALVMPALPGSGKSTLGSALGMSGWRLMSDEFGALDPADGLLRSVLKPAALKNESIPVIQRFGGGKARLGPSFPGTRKGTVAHLLPSPDAVRRVHEPALPACVLLPRWKRDSPTRLEPLDPRMGFSQLAFNAFNYAVTGEAGFNALVDIAGRCGAWQLVYGDLDDAVQTLHRRWPELTSPRPQVADTLTPVVQPVGTDP